jgi:colanic acid/amylovoran biosynthesis glycosyltransferase
MTRLAVITSGFPFTIKEAFLEPELRELSSLADVYLYPVNPRLRTPRVDTGAEPVRMPAFSGGVMAQATLEFLEHPAQVLRALYTLMRSRAAAGVRLKNAAIFAKALAVARDVRRRRIDHVHAYWGSTPATVASVAASINSIPWSFTVHRWDIYENNLLALKAAGASFIRAVSQRGRAALLARIDPSQSAKVQVLHLGVSGALADVEAASSASAASDKRPFTLLCAANLEPVKGHVVLLEALRVIAGRGRDVRCILAGEGSLHGSIANTIAAARLENSVTLAGAVPHDELLAGLARGAYDAAILASIEDADGLHEGIPVFLMEAMAAGVPCIATQTGSISELIDQRCGILVEQRDPQALAAAIELLATDHVLRRTLGSAARARIMSGFAAQDLARRLFASIQDGDREATRAEISATTFARS